MVSVNQRAFLDMIAYSEIGPELLARSDNGYNVVVGGALFSPYDDHPRVKVRFSHLDVTSTAAGRYQILEKYYDFYKEELGLPDFSPASQDAIALRMIAECHAVYNIGAGNIADAIAQCSSRWASFPGADYGQHENKMNDLLSAFKAAGGIIA